MRKNLLQNKSGLSGSPSNSNSRRRSGGLMLSNNLRQALRLLVGMRAYTMINVVGLVVCLTGTIVIARYLNQELTVDSYIPDAERVGMLYNLDEQGTKMHSDGKNWNRCDDFPDVTADPAVESFARFTMLEEMWAETENERQKVVAVAADTNFLKIMPRRVSLGSARMGEMNDALVSESFVRKHFPDGSPLGQTVTLNDLKTPLKIVGVFEEPTTKSSINYDIIMCDDLQEWMLTGWLAVKLREGATFAEFNSRFKPYTEHFGTFDGNRFHFQLMPIREMYFDASVERYRYTDPIPPLGSRSSVRVLLLVAGLLFAIGLFNFLNIYSVVMVRRRRDFGIRKAFGAKKKDVFSLIFTENLLLIALAVGVAWAFVAVVSPMLEKVYSLTQHSSPTFDLALTAFILIVFPLTISWFTTVGIWRTARVHSMDNAETRRSISLRRFLLAPQMAIVFFLLTVSCFFMAQVRFMTHADLGFRSHDIVAFRPFVGMMEDATATYMNDENFFESMRKERERGEMADVMLEKIRQSPLIEHASKASLDEPPLTLGTKDARSGLRGRRASDENAEMVEMDYFFMSREKLELFEYEIVEGEFWENDGEENPSFRYQCLITESAKRALGITDIHGEAVQLSSRLWWDSYGDNTKNPPFEIVGVLKDFRTRHLAAPDLPMILVFEKENDVTYKPMVSFRHENRAEVLAFLREVFAEMNDGAQPEFEFVEDYVAVLYEDDLRASRIYTTFALLAILISCLGLFGVVVYDLRCRQREIRIRKVFGARLGDIFRLIARPYVISLILAVLLAAPLAFLAMRSYQADYHHHISISPSYFLLAALVILLISGATIWLEVRKTYRQTVVKAE